VGLGLLLIILGALGSHRQGIYDWWSLRNYTAPALVAQLATDDTLTSSAQRIFYVNRPQISAKAAFGPVCPSGTEQTVVLGCYHGNQHGIYVLQVTDTRLNGIEQVTAAHELLHAAYDRLSAQDRNRVDSWLTDYYQHDLHDQTILDQIAAYKKSEPHEVVNEMHSLFGTQIASLPAPLEKYYQRYFSNRSAIVQNYRAYEAEFTMRQNAIKADDAQLTSWKAQIDSAESDIKTTYALLQTRQAQLSNLRASNPAAYNQAIPAYNATVDDYNAKVTNLKALISQYNNLVAQRNALVLEAQQLTREITSQVSPLGQ